MKTRTVILASSLALTLASAANASVFNFRSGYVGNAPGTFGQLEDDISCLGMPTGTIPLTAANFAAASSGPMAYVIQPHNAWTALLPSDNQARWINPDIFNAANPLGAPRSAIYAINFTVPNWASATSATFSMDWMIDDVLGDNSNVGIYINNPAQGLNISGGNFATPTNGFANIPTSWLGLNNTLYIYQWDAGAVVSGIIFSGSIRVVPTPASAALLGLGALAITRRRR
ncbi:MAG: hypothetical protein KF757_12665 [Phycisphaeraceae bacterium]|nr:hypothetical protein [Phycisphaeraceae bacterium]MCW5762567.1 hypothetical protein [Phycisphaeraceae bacterium]